MGDVDLVQWTDRGFCYGLVVWLLYRDKDAMAAVKDALTKMASVVERLEVIIKERLKGD